MNDENRYSDKELEAFRKIVQKELEKAEEEFSGLQNRLNDMDKQTSKPSINWSDDSQHNQDRHLVAERITELNKKMEALQAALARIENKTYGICEVTGTLIDKKRLEAMPAAVKSIEAKKKETN